MSAKWLWGTTPIFVNSQDESEEIKRAELFILDGTVSVWNYFGAGSTKYAIKGIVIGDANKNAIKADAVGDTSRTLTTPWGTHASCKINGNVKFVPKMYGGGTIDGVTYTVDVNPIYDAEFEVITTT